MKRVIYYGVVGAVSTAVSYVSAVQVPATEPFMQMWFGAVALITIVVAGVSLGAAFIIVEDELL